MDAPFLEGVPYLSRDEEARARSNAIARQDRNRFKDIFIPEGDLESLQFVRTVRQEILEWQNRSTVRVFLYLGTKTCSCVAQPEPSFLNIAPLNHSRPEYNGRGLNGYQKRLVRKLCFRSLIIPFRSKFEVAKYISRANCPLHMSCDSHPILQK